MLIKAAGYLLAILQKNEITSGLADITYTPDECEKAEAFAKMLDREIEI